jgi:sporulation protein YlmC with PRC-barrel domain
MREMAKVFAGSIAGMEIVNTNGTVLGRLENMVVDLKTGELIDLVVKPESGLPISRYREDGKYVLIPFGSVCAIKDYIVVDEGRGSEKREREV